MADRLLVLDSFLPYRLSYTANLVSEVIADAYQELFALSIPEWRVVAHAAEHDGISQQAIGRRSRMDKVTVSRAAIALTERGLLDRIDNPRDRRSHLLMLTAAGHALYREIAPKALELETRVFGRFAKRKLADLTDMLRQIDEAVLSELGAETPAARARVRTGGGDVLRRDAGAGVVDHRRPYHER